MKRLLPFLLLLCLLACNSKNKVKLVATNAREEVPSLSNLVFTFDKNLVGDSLLHAWRTDEYITFDSPIDGRFLWTNSYELSFSLWVQRL